MAKRASSRSPYKAGTKKLKKGWRFARGGRPVKAKGSRK